MILASGMGELKLAGPAGQVEASSVQGSGSKRRAYKVQLR